MRTSIIDADTAAVLTIPTSIVATYAVVRESTLITRYADVARFILAGMSLLVWVVVISRLAT